jgi:hypothetical protein
MISLFTLLDISPYVLCLPATIICTLRIFSLYVLYLLTIVSHSPTLRLLEFRLAMSDGMSFGKF